MAKKIQTEKTKSKYYSKTTDQRLRRDYSTAESIEELKRKIWEIATINKVTTMSHLAIKLDYKPDELYGLIAIHPELHDFFDKVKLVVGINAFDNIENRINTGIFSKYSVTRYFKEIREESDRIKQEDHARELEKIKARQEADKQALSEFITEVREQNGKKIGVISIDENIKIGE